jgi:hypothetical protein
MESIVINMAPSLGNLLVTSILTCETSSNPIIKESTNGNIKIDKETMMNYIV